MLQKISLFLILIICAVHTSKANTCTRPNTQGYDYTNEDSNNCLFKNGNSNTCKESLSCATGYVGLPDVTLCTSAGGKYSVSGCYNSCLRPTITEGYDYSSVTETLTISDFSVTGLKCASGWSGTVGTVLKCSGTTGTDSDRRYDLTGCTADCTRPTTTGYNYLSESSECLSTGGNANECANSLSCATGFVGSPAVTLCTSPGPYSITGCYDTCLRPTDQNLIKNFDFSGVSEMLDVSGFSVMGLKCANGWTGTPSAPSAKVCTGTSQKYNLVGCNVVVCTRPNNANGYDFTNENAAKCLRKDGNANDCANSLSCNSGIVGSPSVTLCTSPGSAYTLTGCTAVCTTPTTEGYNYDNQDVNCQSTAGNKDACSASLSCANGYIGTPVATLCTSPGAYSVTGCTNSYAPNTNAKTKSVYYSQYNNTEVNRTPPTGFKIPTIVISFAFLVIYLILALIGTMFKANPKMLDNNTINAQQTDPKHIISKSNYEWKEGGLDFKMLVGRNNKIEVIANGGNCIQKCCCPTTTGGVYHISDVQYVQTIMQSPFSCFSACGDTYGWTIQKYILWGTIGIIGLHRFAMLPRPFRVSSWLMIFTEFILGMYLLLSNPGLNFIAIIYFLIWLIDGYLIFGWNSDWSVRIHIGVQNKSVLVSNHVIIDAPFSKAVALQLRKDLYNCMKPFQTKFSSQPGTNELETYTQGSLVFEEKAFCKSTKYSIQLGQYHFTAAEESKSYKEYNDVFIGKLNQLTFDAPAEYPFWYILSGWAPPWGCFGCHRCYMNVGAKWKQYLYGLTLGCFGIGWIVDTFILCCCIDWLKKKGSVTIHFPYSMFAMKVHKKEDAYNFFQYLGTLVSFNVQDDRQVLNSKTYQHRKKYYNKCSDYICGAKQYTDFTTVIKRDEVSITEVFNEKTQPCIYPSFCFPICWMGNVCPILCCCFRKCCTVIESKEDKSIIYLKNLDQFNTSQGSCNCCGSSNKNTISFQISEENVAHFHSREDVTEAEALLTNYVTRPIMNGNGSNFVQQNTSVPVAATSGVYVNNNNNQVNRNYGKQKGIEMVSNPMSSSQPKTKKTKSRRETRHYSEDHGKFYIHDEETNETRWEDEDNGNTKTASKRRRSTRHYSEEHQKYYIHDLDTNETRWEE